MSDRLVDPEYPPVWLAASWNGWEAHDKALEARRYAPPPRPTCSFCGKDIAAIADCAACGDESEMAA